MNTHKNHLKDYRIKQKLTPAQLGELAGVSRQTIFLIEENLYSPSVRLAAKFADIFNTTIDSLLPEIFYPDHHMRLFRRSGRLPAELSRL